jgi:hypothetical protein
MLEVREPPVKEMLKVTIFKLMQIRLKSFQLGDTINPLIYKS